MPLKYWLSRHWVSKQLTSREEIAAIFRKIDRDIAESRKEDISLDWRLVIAYNAALGCATAALRASGYRVQVGGGNHSRTIDSLAHTMHIDEETIIALHAIRKKRHFTSYDAAGTVSRQEVDETIELAVDLRARVLGWLRHTHPELIE